jgi:hypothetical protein
LAGVFCCLIAPWLVLFVMLLLPISARSAVYRATDFTSLPPHRFATHVVSVVFYPVDLFVQSEMSGSLASRDLSQWVGSMRYRAYADHY